MPRHLDIGKQGEGLAEAYLQERGYQILGRNITNPLGKRLGEIDIVAQQKGELVFVEVKTLSGCFHQESYLPEHQVTRSKLRKLERIAEYYMRDNGWQARPYRFDVVAITLGGGQEPEIRHMEHVFL